MPKTTRGSMPMVEWRSLATSHDTLLRAAYEAFEAGDLQEATRQLEMAPAVVAMEMCWVVGCCAV